MYATRTPGTRSRVQLTSSRLIQFLYAIIVSSRAAARLCQAACIPKNSPAQPNQDALARLLQAQDRCPSTALDFRNLVEGSGAKLETTMVNFLSFRAPEEGAFFLFEIVSGQLAGPTFHRARRSVVRPLPHCERSLAFGSATPVDLLVEAIAWDPVKQMFNFYEL